MKKNLMIPSIMIFVFCFVGCSYQPQNALDKNKTKEHQRYIFEKKEIQIEGVDLAYYTDYSKSKFDMLKGKQKFVVFFYSNWCGTCRAWENKVKAAGSTLPTNTVILKANYDNDKDLVEALGVKSQSTVVFFNADGEVSDIVIDPSLEMLMSFFSS